jgi:uroporphyrinogen decarboxylase
MMGAADDAKKHFGNAIDVIEYKYTEKESIARCKAMGVTILPSIYINGKLAHQSIIPSRKELFAEIEKAIASVSK